jgi:tetratricopeptide (TPR) repeat protein
MNATRRRTLITLTVALALILAGGVFSAARAQDSGGKQPEYTMAEYNAYTAADSEKNPAQQIRLLDDFVQKYPNSALLSYVYRSYMRNYYGQKNYPKVIDYADKLLTLGNKADASMRHEAYYARAFAFNSMSLSANDPATKDKALRAREAALAGLKALEDFKKPDTMSAEDFEKQVTLPRRVLFNYAAASAAMLLKDYPGAMESYKAILVLTPNEPKAWSNLGLAYLSSTPPQQLNGFWALAHSISLKGDNETEVRKYLRREMLRFQQTSCEDLLDAEMTELVALAGSSTDRPGSYKLPSSTELEAARKDLGSVIADLKAGGDKGKVTWLASCGLEFPDVPSKLIALMPGTDPNATTLKVAFVTSQEQFDAATTPDMEVKVVGQPEARRLVKDNLVRFTATLVSFDTNPGLMLHWDKAKVNPEDIPGEKKPSVKKPPVRRPPAKKPGR